MQAKKGEGTRLLKNGELAQLVEHLVRNQGVVGSNPIFSTKKKKKEEIYRKIFSFFFLSFPASFSIVCNLQWRMTFDFSFDVTQEINDNNSSEGKLLIAFFYQIEG